MVNHMIESEFSSIPCDSPCLIQGSLHGLIRKYRINKDVLMQSIIDYLFYEKRAPFIVFPGFTFSVFHTLEYDSCKTPEIGYISDYAFRNVKNVVRTSHPMYSFLIIKNKGHLFNVDIQSDKVHCFGENSFYQEMVDAKVVQICMGVEDGKCMTFYHHAEHVCGAKHRFDKNFLVNDSGDIRNVVVYVRNKGIVTDVSGMERLMWKKKVWHGNDADIKGVRWCRLNECLSLMESIPSGKFSDLLYKE